MFTSLILVVAITLFVVAAHTGAYYLGRYCAKHSPSYINAELELARIRATTARLLEAERKFDNAHQRVTEQLTRVQEAE